MERSAYTDEDFKDYNESSHPWKSQKTSCLAEEIDHVVCETELKAESASFRNDVDGTLGITQPECAVDGCGTTATAVNAMESCRDNAVEYIQSQSLCDNSKIAERDTNDKLGNAERAEPQQNSDEDFQTQSVSPCQCDDVVNNTELACQELRHPHVVTISNTTQESDTSLVAHQPQDQADQNNIDLLNGLHITGFLEEGTGSVCLQEGCNPCTPLSRRLFNGQTEGVEEDIAYKLTSTDAKMGENSFRPQQGNY